MKPEQYYDILLNIRKFKGLSKDCAKMLIKKYASIPSNTLYSILSLEIQQKMKISHAKLFGSCKNYYDTYLEAVEQGQSCGILLNMSKKIGAPPALLAKNILEKHYSGNNNVTKSDIAKFLKDTTLIEHKGLAYEIYLCVIYDDLYGPVADAIGLSIGQEYELILQNHLKERNIAFRDEEFLRTQGYDKTPDVKLEIPIALNGFVINWIESKARFGNVEIHQKYIKEQFLSYWNRFGTGLVIYWFGFLDVLSECNEKKFIIMDRFPKNIIYMDPQCIKPCNT